MVTENLWLLPSSLIFPLHSCLIKMTASRPPLGFESFAPREATVQLKAKNLFDWVLIWDCQTSRDDKVLTYGNKAAACSPISAGINSAGQGHVSICQQITQPCHYCSKSWSCGHQCCQNTWSMVAPVMELSDPRYCSTCCMLPLSKGICVSYDILPLSNVTVDRNQ